MPGKYQNGIYHCRLSLQVMGDISYKPKKKKKKSLVEWHWDTS